MLGSVLYVKFVSLVWIYFLHTLIGCSLQVNDGPRQYHSSQLWADATCRHLPRAAVAGVGSGSATSAGLATASSVTVVGSAASGFDYLLCIAPQLWLWRWLHPLRWATQVPFFTSTHSGTTNTKPCRFCAPSLFCMDHICLILLHLICCCKNYILIV
jgi:hypothetical protein